MKHMTKGKLSILRAEGCRPVYDRYGCDGLCGRRCVLLLRIYGKRIYVTPEQYREAELEQPEVWIYDDQAVRLRIDWHSFKQALGSCLKVEGECLEARVGSGRRGYVIHVQVDEDTYRLWQDTIKETGLPPHILLKRLLERSI